MNREDIIRIAQEAQMPFYWRTGEITYLDKLEAFAALVASAERERIKQANAPKIERINSHIKELEEALAQPEQEPVAVVRWNDIGHISWRTHVMLSDDTPLYTTPPQRKPLTDEEIQNALLGYRLVDAIDIARAIESAHGIKG